MRFPWAEMMAMGLGALRLSPRDFWAATPIVEIHSVVTPRR